jgi:hypothetical protein
MQLLASSPPQIFLHFAVLIYLAEEIVTLHEALAQLEEN